MSGPPNTDSVASVLQGYGLTALRSMADHLGVRAPKSKAGLIEKLEALIGEPEAVARALDQLTPAQRMVLDRLMLCAEPVPRDYLPGVLHGLIEEAPSPSSRFSGLLGAVEAGDPDRPESTRVADVIAALSARGLVFAAAYSAYSTTAAELGLRDHVLIPDKVRGALLPYYPAAPPLYEPAPELQSSPGPRSLYRDMFHLWTLIRRKPVALTKEELLRKNDARYLGEALGLIGDGEEFADETGIPYLLFLRHQLTRLGLLLRDGQRLTAAPTGDVRSYFARPWPARTLGLLGDWLDGKVAISVPIYSIGLNLEQHQRIYRRLVEYLPRLPDGWMRIDDFDRTLRIHDPQLLYSSEDRRGIYSYAFRYVPISLSWEQRESLIIRWAVEGPLAWLGVLDLARGVDGGWAGFRVGAAGRALVDALLAGRSSPAVQAAPPVSAEGRVIVQPNFQVFAVGDVADDLLLRLSEVAELVRLDQAVEFKLTRESVHVAQQTGWAGDEIIAFLREVSGAPLAQNVERSLRDWSAVLDRVLIRRNAALLLALDPGALDLLQDNPALRPWIASRPLPGVALLQAPGGRETLSSLRRALSGEGELPAVTDVRAGKAIPSFQLDAEGRVDFRVPLPDLRLLGLLALVAAPGEQGLRLSEERVRASVAARRWKIDDINTLLRDLAAWHVGPLPASAEARIKSWAGFYGRAELRTVTLLVLEREELLQELLADPQLSALLQPLSGAGAVAIVAPTSPSQQSRPARRKAAGAQEPAPPGDDAPAFERLRTLLAERGFAVEG